jgi:hypothetical protein
VFPWQEDAWRTEEWERNLDKWKKAQCLNTYR